MLMTTSTPARVEGLTAKAYRLFKKKDGVLVLQGAFEWREGCNGGVEWKDLPTVEEDNGTTL